MALCTVAGCDAPVQTRGRCAGHYSRDADPRVARANIPNPAPVIELRRKLQRSRAQGARFVEAWPGAVAVALDGLAEDERTAWEIVMTIHAATWAQAYRREPFEVLDAISLLA